MKTLLLPLVSLALATSTFASIAITEFSNTPANTDQTTEFIELFNFSSSSVNLTGWTFQDTNGTGSISGNPILASGEYLVVTRNTGDFNDVWFGGASTAGVILNIPTLATGGEFVQLKNGSGDIIWSAGASGDLLSQSDAATLALAANFDFSSIAPTGYVASASLYTASVVADSNFSYTSLGSNGSGSGDIGSPLAGGYTAIPEPSSFILILGSFALLRVMTFRRR